MDSSELSIGYAHDDSLSSDLECSVTASDSNRSHFQDNITLLQFQRIFPILVVFALIMMAVMFFGLFGVVVWKSSKYSKHNPPIHTSIQNKWGEDIISNDRIFISETQTITEPRSSLGDTKYIHSRNRPFRFSSDLKTYEVEFSTAKLSCSSIEEYYGCSTTDSRRNSIYQESRQKFDDYNCQGSCWCENQPERRLAAAMTGISLVVGAASTIFAFRVAQQVLEDRCMDRFDDCPKDSIFSTIENCFPAESEETESNNIFSSGEELKDDHCSTICYDILSSGDRTMMVESETEDEAIDIAMNGVFENFGWVRKKEFFSIGEEIKKANFNVRRTLPFKDSKIDCCATCLGSHSSIIRFYRKTEVYRCCEMSIPSVRQNPRFSSFSRPFDLEADPSVTSALEKVCTAYFKKGVEFVELGKEGITCALGDNKVGEYQKCNVW